MKKQIKKKTETELLRQKAEELLRNQQSERSSYSAEADILKLNHELSVHQIELEIQNKELMDAKKDLEIAVEKYTDLYDLAPSGYLTITREGQIVELNLSASRMLGKERRRLLQNMLGAYVTDDKRQIFYHFLNGIFDNQTELTCELTLNRKGNLPMHIYLMGFISKNGLHAEINMIDITEHKLAEEKVNVANRELEQSIQLNADKDLFISILAHDLRNPFGVLLGYTELLLRNFNQLKENEVKNMVHEINQTTHSTYNLLEDILKWSRLRMERIPFEPKQVSFTDICIDIVSSLSPVAEIKNITIGCNIADEIYVIADVDMLKAVFRNLVSNAIKFTRNKGKIMISAEQRNSGILFSVSDNGIGIEPESLVKLFDISQFFTTTGTANEKGTGLGLLLCKDFVEKHGGKIWVESEFGKGSVFYFEIPGKPESKVNIVASDSKEANHIFNLKVLIAEDNAALRMILGAMLQNYSKEILYAETGVEAVTVFSNNPDIDLIMMDLNMPKLDGSEAIKLIRAISKNVVIIAETAKSLSEVTEETSGYGINDFFFKPYSRQFLNELIFKHFYKKNTDTFII